MLTISNKDKADGIKEAVVEFMTNQMHVYNNHNDVEIVMNDDRSIIVCTELHEGITDDDISLELVSEYETIEEFIEVFGITSPGCIKDIIPASLMSMYYEGRAEISCIIDGYITYNLDFRIRKDKMIATDGEGAEHEVPVILETTEEFTQYTRQYFDLLSDHKIRKRV